VLGTRTALNGILANLSRDRTSFPRRAFHIARGRGPGHKPISPEACMSCLLGFHREPLTAGAAHLYPEKRACPNQPNHIATLLWRWPDFLPSNTSCPVSLGPIEPRLESRCTWSGARNPRIPGPGNMQLVFLCVDFSARQSSTGSNHTCSARPSRPKYGVKCPSTNPDNMA